MLSFLLLIVFLFQFQNAQAQETRSGGRTSGGSSSGSGSRASEQSSKSDRPATACPPALVEWVNDDYQDKTDMISGAINTMTNANVSIFDFKSEAKTCTSTIKVYEDSIRISGKKTNLSDSEDMSNFLADRYKQISPSVKNTLNMCNNLPDGKDKIVKNRYYMATSKMEAANSSILDEVAYIDSVLPSSAGQVVQSMSCNPIYPFPKVGEKCTKYQNMLNDPSCRKAQSDRLNALVYKTKKIMGEVEELRKVYFSNCRGSLASKNPACPNLSLAIQLLKNEAPWIDGKKFKEKAYVVSLNPTWKDQYKDEALRQGIMAQLTEDRKSLQKQYDTNLKQVQCLTYSTYDGKAPCSFDDTRKYIAQLPDLVDPDLSHGKNRKMTEYDNYIEAEKCLLERGQDRENTRNVINNAATDALLVASTLGVGWVAQGGLKVVQGASAVSKLKNVALANASLAGLNMAPGLR